MEIKIEGPEIRRLEKNELIKFRELIELFHEVFETEGAATVDEIWLGNLLESPYFIAFAVIHNDVVLGGATGYVLPMYSPQTSELFIYDVAIHRRAQRSGLGNKLILSLKEFCRQNKISEMFVPAHEEDIHALDFYKATGGVAEKVIHFNYPIK